MYQIIYAGGNPNLTESAPTDSSSALLNNELNDYSRDGNVSWYQMFTNVPMDYYHFFENNFSKDEVPDYINLAILTGSLMTFDQTSWKFQSSLYKRSSFDQNTSNLAIQLGNSTIQLIISASFASEGIIFHNERSLKTASNIIESVLTTGLFVQMLKRITGRESPAVASESGGEWVPMPSFKHYQKNQPKYYSFPSGHLSTATAIMTVIANNYPDAKWLKPVSYSLLGVLGFSLVSKGMHWYSDLPLAYFIGYSFGNIISPAQNIYARDIESTPGKHFLITPFVNINGVALNATYSF